jgi:hypothetical protein
MHRVYVKELEGRFGRRSVVPASSSPPLSESRQRGIHAPRPLDQAAGLTGPIRLLPDSLGRVHPYRRRRARTSSLRPITAAASLSAERLVCTTPQCASTSAACRRLPTLGETAASRRNRALAALLEPSVRGRGSIALLAREFRFSTIRALSWNPTSRLGAASNHASRISPSCAWDVERRAHELRRSGAAEQRRPDPQRPRPGVEPSGRHGGGRSGGSSPALCAMSSRGCDWPAVRCQRSEVGTASAGSAANARRRPTPHRDLRTGCPVYDRDIDYDL